MISLQTGASTGKTCPKCGNGSVFPIKIYKFFGLIYSHTVDRCEMGPSCDYEDLSEIRNQKIDKILN